MISVCLQVLQYLRQHKFGDEYDIRVGWDLQKPNPGRASIHPRHDKSNERNIGLKRSRPSNCIFPIVLDGYLTISLIQKSHKVATQMTEKSLRRFRVSWLNKIVEYLSRTAWQTWRRPGVNNAPKLLKPSHPFIHGDADWRSLALAKHLQKKHLNEPGRIRFIGNASALLLGGVAHARLHRRSNQGADMSGARMNSVMITALAAIAGSLVGALGSAVGTWITARHQDRRDLLGKQIARREALYSDFIGESARLLVDAMQHNVVDLQKLLPVYALLSRIRLSCSEPVLQTAEKVIQTIVKTYPQPNLTAEQIESRAVDGQDPLAQFSDTCRTELESLQRQL
jgi:hypothetical protein